MATVDTAMDQAIRKDQKSFLKQTGEKAVEDATMPTTGMGAETMLSPTAGKLGFSPPMPTYAKQVQAYSSKPLSWTRARAPST